MPQMDGLIKKMNKTPTHDRAMSSVITSKISKLRFKIKKNMLISNQKRIDSLSRTNRNSSVDFLKNWFSQSVENDPKFEKTYNR